jgi:hypothetical protein
MNAPRVLCFLAIAVAILILPACGGSVASGDLPKYPGATELKPGETPVGNTLAQNMSQDEAVRKAMGVGGKTEQTGFVLPVDTQWAQVKEFYDKELAAAGWKSGLGGIAGGFVDVNAVMGTANKGNDLFQTAIWSRGKQTLTAIMVKSPTNSKQKELILSLSTQ